MDSPFFSIIVPCYNSSKTIVRALESVISQHYNNYEILVIDGASHDNTVELANSFNDPRILIYSNRDFGVYDAMNIGIKISKGDWLYFLGSDDRLFDSDVLSKVSKIILSAKADILYGNVIRSGYSKPYDGEFNVEKIIKSNICHQAIFFNRVVFSRIGVYDTYFKILADWDFNMKWFFDRSVRGKHIELIIAEYADNGLSSRILDKSFMRLLQWRIILAKRYSHSFRSRVNYSFNFFILALRSRHFRDAKKILSDLYIMFEKEISWFQ